MIIHSETKTLECPYCLARCQFNAIKESLQRKTDYSWHLAYYCEVCRSVIVATWEPIISTDELDNMMTWHQPDFHLATYHPNPSPKANEWKPRVDLSLIINDDVRNCFKESINCYNYKLYNACMITARGTIEQEMLDKEIGGGNLYEKIENTGISIKFKKLLHKVRDIGNHGAHPTVRLFDDNKKEITSKEKIAELSLELLDRYFMDAYEIDELLRKSPKTRRELEEIEKKLDKEN